MLMILRNQAMCPKCDDHIMSINRHDYRSCKCGDIAVDGGPDYLRRSFKDEHPIETSISIPVDISRFAAADYLGILSAFEHYFGPGRHILATKGIWNACREQELERPWFHTPKNLKALRKQLRQLEEWGHVEQCYRTESTRLYWRSRVELAPWPEPLVRRAAAPAWPGRVREERRPWGKPAARPLLAGAELSLASA
jgi:hypothetical protein